MSDSTSGDSSVRIGQELVRRKLATLHQVREALAEQQKLRESGQDTPLGAIMVSRGMLRTEDLKEVLSVLDLLVLYCPSCSVTMAVSEYDQSNQYLCQRCESELVYAAKNDKQVPRKKRRKKKAKPETAAPPSPELTPVPTPELIEEEEAAAPVSSTSSEPLTEGELVGRVVGGCKIIRKIARGGMGTVFEAEQINLGRKVALKVLAKELAEDEIFVRRFLLEARAAASLNHPNIIHINDAGQADGIFFFTMEFIDGENLAQLLRRRRRLPLEQALEVTEQVARALECAHGGEIIHRDIKPENIMLSQSGVVKVADLGLAKKTIGEAATSTLTQAGSILGTPYYMAPEQARDFRSADGRSDLYSLGVSLYKMVTGKVPFDGTSPIEVIMKALEGKKTPVRELRPELSADYEAFIDRMMAMDPLKRHQSASEVLAEIPQLRSQLATPSR